MLYEKEMVETRFDRGVYEDDEDESNQGGGGSSSSNSGGGGGGGSSSRSRSDINQELNPFTPDPTDDKNSKDSLSKDTIAPNRPRNGEQPVSDRERIAPDVPETGDSVDTDNDGSNDAIVIDSGDSSSNGSSSSGSTGGSYSPPSKDTIAPNQPDPDKAGGSGPSTDINQELNPETPDPSQKNNEAKPEGAQKVVNEAKDIPLTLRQNRGGFTDNLRQIGRETQDLGRALQEEGSKVGQNVEETVSTTLGGGTAAARGVEQPSGLAERTGQLTGGISTLGTQMGGFFIEGGGGIIELRADDIEDPSEFEGSRKQTEGIQRFGGEVKEQVGEDPVGFVLEEGGEEIGEAAVGGLLLGPAGVALGATPTVEPEVEPEVEQEIQNEPEVQQQVSTLENEVEPENIPENEQVPRGIIETQTPQLEQERSRTPETFEKGGIQRTEMDAGPEVIGRQPSSKEFESSPEQAQSRDFVEEDTGFLPEEQEVIRDRRGREDITLRQEENLLRDFGPGETRPEEGATVLEAEKTETGGELLFSFMGPVPITPDIEPEKELNPQPPQADVTGPTSDSFNSNIDLEPEQEPGLTQDTEPETTTSKDLLIESETEVNSVFTEVEPRQDQNQTPSQTQPQDNPLQQEPENVFEEPTQQTSAEPSVETGLNQFVEKNTAPETEPRTKNPGGPLGGLPPFQTGNTEEPQNIFSTQQPERGPERTPSLDAVVLGITSEDTGGDDEFFTGFETRPISTRETEEEFKDLF